jgi:hypothetical protein
MLRHHPVASGVWRILEEIYLDAASEQVACDYASLSDADKRTALKEFTKRQAVTSKRWSQILQNLLSADLDDWRQKSRR